MDKTPTDYPSETIKTLDTAKKEYDAACSRPPVVESREEKLKEGLSLLWQLVLMPLLFMIGIPVLLSLVAPDFTKAVLSSCSGPVDCCGDPSLDTY